MIIKVTEDHIKCGQRKVARACPIALAIKGSGAIENPVLISGSIFSVDSKYIQSHPADTYTLIANMPKEVRQFISRFDKGLKVEPFEFELERIL